MVEFTLQITYSLLGMFPLNLPPNSQSLNNVALQSLVFVKFVFLIFQNCSNHAEFANRDALWEAKYWQRYYRYDWAFVSFHWPRMKHKESLSKKPCKLRITNFEIRTMKLPSRRSSGWMCDWLMEGANVGVHSQALNSSNFELRTALNSLNRSKQLEQFELLE